MGKAECHSGTAGTELGILEEILKTGHSEKLRLGHSCSPKSFFFLVKYVMYIILLKVLNTNLCRNPI